MVAQAAQQDPLVELERAVYASGSRDHRAAVKRLHLILANLKNLGGDVESSRRSHFYFRLAMAISTLLLDDSHRIELSDYRLLCASHPAIAAVFACTPLQDADHLIAQLADVSDIRNIRFRDADRLMKALLCYSLYSRFDLDIRALSERFPEIIAPLLLGMLGYDLYSRPAVEHKINRLLEQDWPVLRAATPDLPMVVTTSRAWMNCSYATAPDKHRIKQDLNAMIRNGIAARGLSVSAAAYDGSKQRPLIVVPVELFNSKHAMFRCFSRVVNRLRERFEVIGVAPANVIDEDALRVFDDSIIFDAGEAITDLQPLLDRIRERGPDIVYYPSLGMANYSLILANLRLAPVQCFTLGHPASTHIDTIDYAIVQQQDFTTADIYSERVVLTGNDTSPTINLVRQHLPEPEVRRQPDTIEVAVTSKHMKINHGFLATCREIAGRTDRALHFRFFPGVNGLEYEFVRHEIQRMLPGAEVYPTTDYATYIHNLSACDIRLGTFPFGGANTNMDCFGLGIPFVVLDGIEPHAHSDAAQLAQSGLPGWLVAQDRDAYIAAALRLIDEDATRVSLCAHMLTLYDNDFFVKDMDDSDMVFDDTMMWLYRNHERLQASAQRVWRREDQLGEA